MALPLIDPRCNHPAGDGCMWCCDRCNYDMHLCPGCGDILGHGQHVCRQCEVLLNDEQGVSGYEL